MMRLGIIYCAKNKINGMKYIGFTRKTLSQRKRDHQGSANKENPKQFFHKALKEFGFDNFEWEIIFQGCLPVESLGRLEKATILSENTRYPNGYNKSQGGDFAKEMSQETRDKISRAHKGRVVSPETTEKNKKTRQENLAKLSKRDLAKIKEAQRKCKRGELNPVCKLTDAKVIQIKREMKAAADKSVKIRRLIKLRLAESFGVAYSTICAVVKGTKWSHVKSK